MTKRMSTALKRTVAARAHDRCEYCQSPAAIATQSFTIDHIRPRASGGKTRLNNLAWACLGCNHHKHTKRKVIDPLTQKSVQLFNPRRQAWSEHFAWNEDATRIIGQTPCGRATVEALQLNRPALVNLRRILVLANVHPPSEE